MIFSRDQLKVRLQAICEGHSVADQARMKVYESDGLTAKKQLPWLVLLPATIEQVQLIMQLCHAHQVPVVARGAGTGLSGGAMPHHEGVLLSLARFNRILEVDQVNLLARVEPGVTNLAISDHVRPLGLFYAPDPSSQIACTIGGNVAENSGGVHCLKYGLTVHNVRKLVMISPEGERYELGSEAFDSAGYDLLALMHGSEGMLGIVVEVTVKLLPLPVEVAVLLAAFTDVGQAADAVGQIIDHGLIPAGLEMMDKLAVQAAEAFVHADYPLDAAAILICELDGSSVEIEQQQALLTQVLLEAGAVQVRCAKDAEERRKLWLGRKAAFPAVGRLAPD